MKRKTTPMMRHLTALLALLLALLLAACATANHEPVLLDATAPGPEESIIVIGASNSQYKYNFLPVSVKDGMAYGVYFSPGIQLSGWPREGYIVGRVNGGQTLAMHAVIGPSKDGKIRSMIFCIGSRKMVFEVPKGKVIYIGDIHVREQASGFGAAYGSDYAAARRHIDGNYYHLAGRLEPWTFETLPGATERKCD
jgi:hypothetical protein